MGDFTKLMNDWCHLLIFNINIFSGKRRHFHDFTIRFFLNQDSVQHLHRVLITLICKWHHKSCNKLSETISPTEICIWYGLLFLSISFKCCITLLYSVIKRMCFAVNFLREIFFLTLLPWIVQKFSLTSFPYLLS